MALAVLDTREGRGRARRATAAGHRGFQRDNHRAGGPERTNAGGNRADGVGGRAAAAERNVARETAERAQLQGVGDARTAACDRGAGGSGSRQGEVDAGTGERRGLNAAARVVRKGEGARDRPWSCGRKYDRQTAAGVDGHGGCAGVERDRETGADRDIRDASGMPPLFVRVNVCASAVRPTPVAG